jgi:hypothetical protein
VSSDGSHEAGYVLVIHLREPDGRERSVELEFVEQPVVDLERCRVRYGVGGHDPYDLLEFCNEQGVSLAVLANAYVRHEVRSA